MERGGEEEEENRGGAWWVSLLLMGLLGVGAIGMGGMTMGVGSVFNQVKNSSTPTPSSAVVTPMPIVGSPAAMAVAVGEAMVNANGRRVTVTGFTANFKTENLFESPRAGAECVKVAVDLLNGSKKEWPEPLLDVTAVDGNGVVHQWFDNTDCGLGIRVAGLTPGGGASTDVRFEVPSGSALTVRWQDFGSSQVLETKLR